MRLRSSSRSSELRIVLLGPKNSGKSSAGNAILGKKEFDLKKTLQCVEIHSEIAGTKITVVDTPGWWGNLPFEENPELYKQEIVLSVSKCPPGPHVLLLVLNVDTPFKQNKDILCDNMKHFGDGVWKHTIVLFTSTDHPEDTTARVFENETLQWLFEICGYRYHVLSTKNWGDGSQVTELLKKIQDMVQGNRGCHYEIDRHTLQCVEEKRREQETRADERRMKYQQLKDKTRTTGEEHPLSELRIVLLGYNGSGKSSAGNIILGKSAFDLKRSLTSVIREGDVAGRHITVVDTPGRRRNYCSKYTPRLYKDEVVLSSSHCPPGPHVFLLVIRVDVSFTEVYRKAVEEHAACNGSKIWDHMIVLFTFGDWLRDKSIELFIESEEALQWIIDKCGNRYHVFNNRNKDDGNQVTELFEKIEERVEGRCFTIDHQHLQEVKERRMKVEERAKKMRAEVQKRNESGHSGELSEIRLVLFGPCCSNKSSTGNTILGRKAFVRRSEKSLKEDGNIAGRKLTVVFTPGFEKDFLIGKRLEDAKLNLLRSVTKCSSEIHAFILVLCVDCSFAEEEKSALEKIMEPLGERVWNQTLVVFAVEDELGDTPIELFIASEGDALQWLIEKCGKRYQVLNNKSWGDGAQVTELLQKIEEMVAGNRGRSYELDKETLQVVEEKRKREQEKRAEERRMKNQQLKYEIDKERVDRTVPVPVKKQRSMDIPLNISGECRPSSESSAYVSASILETSGKHHFHKSLCSEKTSGLESLDYVPDTDGESCSE